MGTILTNPWDLNFGLVSKRAESFAASTNLPKLFSKRSTLTTNCDVASYRGDFHVVKEEIPNPNPNNYPQIRTQCESEAGNPDRSNSNDHLTKDYCKPRYFVYYTAPNDTFPSNPSYLFPVNDSHGRAILDSDGTSYTLRQGNNGSYYDDEADAIAVRDAVVAHWNGFSAPSGCSDQNALNYSPGAGSGPCPCDAREPNFPDEKYLGSATGNWPAQTTHTTTYTNVNNATGDCSCMPKPEGRYILQEWSYQGIRDCWGSGVKPDYCYGGFGNSQRATEFWGWEEPEVSSKSSNRGQDGSFTYAPGDPAPHWTYTYENKSLSVCPPDHICSSVDEEEFWTWEQGGAKKFQVTKCGGNCEKMGCMDEEAINYDPDAEVQPSQPATITANAYASNVSDNDKKRLTQYQQDIGLWKKYDCIYCNGDNENGTYDSKAKHCECVAGYSWIDGKCQKAGQGQDEDKDAAKPPMSLSIIMGIIVGVSLIGMATVSSFKGGN